MSTFLTKLLKKMKTAPHIGIPPVPNINTSYNTNAKNTNGTIMPKKSPKSNVKTTFHSPSTAKGTSSKESVNMYLGKDKFDELERKYQAYIQNLKSDSEKMSQDVENSTCPKDIITIDDTTLIVSMTSWPKRINYCSKVFFSIMENDCPKDKYHLVLVLCEAEFPNKESDFPESLRLMVEAGDIELIWHPTNIFSHKKLMPVLRKYPNNPILVCDDDIVRPKNWLSSFLKDHTEYPNDIIVGGCVFDITFDGNVFNPIKNLDMTCRHMQVK